MNYIQYKPPLKDMQFNHLNGICGHDVEKQQGRQGIANVVI